jgi:glycosyltransferase involved in cell wall biosynthesis
MKVLHLLSSNKLSGAENVVVEIISMFDGKVEMAYTSPDGDIRSALKKRNINFLPLEKFSFKEFKKIINIYNPDVIHAHDIKATLIACLSTKKVPIVSHLHGNPHDMKRISLKSLLYLACTKRIKKIITVSDSVLDEYVFSSKILSKSMVIYNVINKEYIFENVCIDKNEYNYDFIFLGRLEHPKDPIRVAQVARNVIRNIPNVKFGIIGDGSFRVEMEEMFVSEGVINNIHFLGFLKNPYKVLSQAKVMLMCSRYEGIPMAALEALVLGVPIVSTPVDGMRILIENGRNGFLSESDDELVKYITEIIIGKNHSYLSREAKKSMSKYTNIENYTNELNMVYQSITNS